MRPDHRADVGLFRRPLSSGGPRHAERGADRCGAVQDGILTLPTYEEGLPDVNPPFDVFATQRFNYPYTLRHNLTDRRAVARWRTLNLENEYLKVVVLPDLGGHLYSCVDKATGADMFYANRSIQKAQIAYRGAWAAFGIEFNFPVSHNWATVVARRLRAARRPGRQRVDLGRATWTASTACSGGSSCGSVRAGAPRAARGALQP